MTMQTETPTKPKRRMATMAPKPNEKRRFSQMLACKLDDSALLKIARKLVATRKEIDTYEFEKKQENDHYKELIDGEYAKQSELAAAFSKASEDRTVSCEEIKDFRTGRVTVRRLDTKDIVSERAMTAEERQLAMFKPEKEPKVAPAPKKSTRKRAVKPTGETSTHHAATNGASTISDPKSLLDLIDEGAPAPKRKRGKKKG